MTDSTRLMYVPEPDLLFRSEQRAEDARDGLALFGPLDAGKPYGMRIGVVGAPEGIDLYRKWVRRVVEPVVPAGPIASHPVFPGFEAAFGIGWACEPTITAEIDRLQILKSVGIPDQHQRVFQTVELFTSKIADARRRFEEAVDLWYVVIPDEVYLYCRPQSRINDELRTENPFEMNPKLARVLRSQRSMFDEDNRAAEVYSYEVDFHHQLKARLLGTNAPTQVVKESTLRRGASLDGADANAAAAIAWNLTSAAFYKAGGRPWKAGAVRDGVCYIGLVFKEDASASDGRSACCAAQMFIDSGDGFVFRSAHAGLRAQRKGSFHLSREGASHVLRTALDAYREQRNAWPTEVFVHGRVRFDHDEWEGFASAAPSGTAVTGVSIRDSHELKLYRQSKYPVLRGLALSLNARSSLLWTRGYVPRLMTYPGLEVPNPLAVTITHGDSDPRVVLADILALTKLNYNACIHSDGLPVTLKFADAVGEILTAAPRIERPPLPFKHYI